MIVMMFGYLLYGLIANRFTAGHEAASSQPAAVPVGVPKMAGVSACLMLVFGLLAAGEVHAQTLARIQRAGRINVGYLTEQPPFSYTGPDRRPKGYAVDLCNSVVEGLRTRLHFPELIANYVPANRATALELVESGQIDILCGAVPETLKARERVSFSIPIYVGGIGVLVRADAPAVLTRILNGQVPHTGPTWRATINGGLESRVYAVLAGSTSESWVRERLTSAGVIAKVVTVRTQEAGIALVRQKQADAFFADRMSLQTYVTEVKGSDSTSELTVLDRRFTLEPAALALTRGDEDFRLAVDTALSHLYRSSDILPTYTRYFGEPTETARMLFQAYAVP
jgi:polar amino acid transport system substrate-binding protein